MSRPPYELDKLLKPRSVAIVGASPRADSMGLRVLSNLRRHGFAGEVFPINPRYQEVEGLRCYPSLSALPGPVDAAFFAVPAEQGPALLDEAGRCGIGAAVITASGYADGGAQGIELQRRLAEIAARHEIAVCGPNNTGFLNLFDATALWTAPPSKAKPGPVAIISQSGSVAMVLSHDDRALGIGYAITPGNEAVLTAADYLRYVAEDERIRVVMMFLETIRDPELFAAAASDAWSRGKRIVAVKIGRTESGRAAVAAHTGSLSGEDQVYSAFFRRHGVIRAGDIDEMIETAALLLSYPDPPITPHIVPITLSGGEAALVADLGSDAGVSMPALAEETVARLRPTFPPFATPRNPLDGWGLGFTPERSRQMIEALAADPAIGTIVCAVDAPASGGLNVRQATEMAKICVSLAAATDKRFVFFNNMNLSPVDPGVRAVLAQAGIPYLSGMRQALAAIGHWTRLEPPRQGARPEAMRPAAVPLLVADLRALSEPDRLRRLRQGGIEMAECVVVTSADEACRQGARIGYPVTMKGSASDLPHKTELGLVRIGLADAVAVTEAFGDLSARLARHARVAAGACVVMQPMIGPGIELIVGARRDPAFGPIVVAGVGGTLVELLREVAIRLGPVDSQEAAEMLRETRAGRMLDGLRGAGPFDLDAAARAIAALSSFAAANPGLRSIEINPLIVLPRGRGAIGVDLVVE